MTQLTLPAESGPCAGCKRLRHQHPSHPACRVWIPPRQLTLDDARAQRDEALARVEKNAGTWVNEAFAFVREYLLTHPTMFCDDLWDAGLPWPSNAKALGAVMVKAVKSGLMEKVGYRPSVHSRGSIKPVWKSLVFAGARRGTA